MDYTKRKEEFEKALVKLQEKHSITINAALMANNTGMVSNQLVLLDTKPPPPIKSPLEV